MEDERMMGTHDMAASRTAPEIRVRVPPETYRALQREAAAADVTVAVLLRRIVARHYQRLGEGALEPLWAALSEASAERRLLVVMLDLLYQGLLVRLAKPEASVLEERIADAKEGHWKWRAELARRLADGGADGLLTMIREAGKLEEAASLAVGGGGAMAGARRRDANRTHAAAGALTSMEKSHVGMGGGPCRCTPERREEFTRGCPDVCRCHGVAHADCPRAKPCLGRCGRLTTAHETQVPGYCPHCAADDRWTPLEDC